MQASTQVLVSFKAQPYIHRRQYGDHQYEQDVVESLQLYFEDAKKTVIQAYINESLKTLAAGFADQKEVDLAPTATMALPWQKRSLWKS